MRPLSKKIIVIVFAAGLYCVLERFSGISTSLESLRITYAQPFIVWVSVLGGPLIGGIAGGIGELISQIWNPEWDWPVVLCTILNCAAIGFFTNKIDVNSGFFGRNDIFYFEKVQIISNLIVWEIPYTALNMWLREENWTVSLYRGFWIALNNLVSCMMLTSLFLALYVKSRMTAANFYRE